MNDLRSRGNCSLARSCAGVPTPSKDVQWRGFARSFSEALRPGRARRPGARRSHGKAVIVDIHRCIHKSVTGLAAPMTPLLLLRAAEGRYDTRLGFGQPVSGVACARARCRATGTRRLGFAFQETQSFPGEQAAGRCRAHGLLHTRKGPNELSDGVVCARTTAPKLWARPDQFLGLSAAAGLVFSSLGARIPHSEPKPAPVRSQQLPASQTRLLQQVDQPRTLLPSPTCSSPELDLYQPAFLGRPPQHQHLARPFGDDGPLDARPPPPPRLNPTHRPRLVPARASPLGRPRVRVRLRSSPVAHATLVGHLVHAV